MRYFGGKFVLRLGWTWALSVLLLISVSAEPAKATHPRPGGTLRLAASSDIRTLDPAGIYSWLEGLLTMMLYCPLLDYDENEQRIPRLAEALPEVSADGLTYTLRLRPGVRFSNGREVEADDAAYSLERHLDPHTGSSYGFYYQNIVGAEEFVRARAAELASTHAPSPGVTRWIEPVRLPGLRVMGRHALEIRLTKPDFIFADILAIPNSVIVPREEVERRGTTFGTRPVGSGPFMFKEWIRGVRLRLERNPHYYLSDEPYLEAVDVLFGPDEATQVMMFERGELDYLSGIPSSDFVRLHRSPRSRPMIVSREGAGPNYIALNCELPPFHDRRVRQAMNYAVNKDRVLKVLNQRGVLARGPLPPSLQGFNAGLPGYPHDPARAKGLLAEAGFANGFQTELWVSDESEWRLFAPVIQQDLAQVGVLVDLKYVNGVAIYAAQQRKKVALSIWDWMATFNDPRDTLDTLLNGERITDENCLNVAFYSNPQVNELFRRADQERDANRRLALYREAEELIAADAPWIFLYHANRYQLRQPWLRGMFAQPRMVWPERLERAWIER